PMANVQKTPPFLWFDGQAEEAAKHYTSIFEGSKIHSVSRYGEAGHEVHGREPGTAMTVEFSLAGQTFTALNGGPLFRFTEAVSFVVHCGTQAGGEYCWERVRGGGGPPGARWGRGAGASGHSLAAPAR